MLESISANPASFASLASAIVAASVALTVFALTQFLMRKRERTQFLTPKLEELYLLINEVSENNAKFFKLIHLCLDGDSEARRQIEGVDDLDLYGHRIAKRIIMYTRLYFPRLSFIHQRLYWVQRDLNHLIYDLHSNRPPELATFIEASGKVGHFLRLFEEEIFTNRDHLLADHIFPKRYLQTSQAAIEEPVPPPDGPVMHPRRDD